MTALCVSVFYGIFFAAGLRWILTVESSSTTSQIPKDSKNPNSNALTSVDHARVNPATGLPMVGLFNVNGNPFGHSSTSFHHGSVNPANGLPMVGGLDVAGNAYGFSN
jgi:hypothetical protein